MQPYRQIAQALSEADLTAQQDGVRGQAVTEFFRLYQFCMDNVGENGESRPDPRFAELAVRIWDRIIKLYRLDKATPAIPDEQDGQVLQVTQAQLAGIAASLDEMARRSRGDA